MSITFTAAELFDLSDAFYFASRNPELCPIAAEKFAQQSIEFKARAEEQVQMEIEA